MVEIKADKGQQEIFININDDKKDFYADEGCCLTCRNSYDGCLCLKCKCKKCKWYEELEGLIKPGRCSYTGEEK